MQSSSFSQIDSAATAIKAALNEPDSTREEKCDFLIARLGPEICAELLLSFPFFKPEAPVIDAPEAVNLFFAAQTAEMATEEWGQAFYHFAVRVTRMLPRSKRA